MGYAPVRKGTALQWVRLDLALSEMLRWGSSGAPAVVCSVVVPLFLGPGGDALQQEPEDLDGSLFLCDSCREAYVLFPLC